MQRRLNIVNQTLALATGQIFRVCNVTEEWKFLA